MSRDEYRIFLKERERGGGHSVQYYAQTRGVWRHTPPPRKNFEIYDP